MCGGWPACSGHADRAVRRLDCAGSGQCPFRPVRPQRRDSRCQAGNAALCAELCAGQGNGADLLPRPGREVGSRLHGPELPRHARQPARGHCSASRRSNSGFDHVARRWPPGWHRRRSSAEATALLRLIARLGRAMSRRHARGQESARLQARHLTTIYAWQSPGRHPPHASADATHKEHQPCP